MASARLKRAVVINSLWCLAVSQSAAQLDWTGSVGGQLSGADARTSAQLVPTLGLSFQGKQFDLSSQLTTRLDSAQTQLLPDSWQSQNQLNWKIGTGLISGGFGFDHQQKDPPKNLANRQANDDLSASLRLTVPQTLSLIHQVDLTGQYRQRRSGSGLENQLNEWSGLGNYGLNWRPNARTRWSTGVGFTISDSGAQSVNSNLNWNWQSVRFGYNAALTGSHTEQDGQSADNLGWNATATYQNSLLGLRVRAEHSQTDAISFFEMALIETPIEQQTQVLVDQLTFGLFGVQPLPSVTLSADYIFGRSSNLFSLELIDLENQTSLSYQQINTGLVWQLSSQSSLNLAWQRRLQDGVASSAATASISRTLSSHWSAGGSLQRDLTRGTHPLNWSVSMNYQL